MVLTSERDREIMGLRRESLKWVWEEEEATFQERESEGCK